MNPLHLLLIIPLCIAVLGLYPRGARWLPNVAAAAMVAQLCIVVGLCVPVLRHPVIMTANYGIDGISAAFLIITTLVVASALIQAAFLLPAERDHDASIPEQRLCFFYTLAGLFMLAMYGVLLAQHLGYAWIAMEATTLLSAPLVYYHRTRHSLEATWKYLLLCSVGIGFALFGIMLIVASQQSSGTSSLTFGVLQAHAASFDPRLLRLGFIFCVLGFGTKAGLFPLHNWLPDAHSEAPAPASAMLSGAL
ncbi:MAG TPA: proton-conducting transporter membrane subunit, partial [Novimethylophilus sp.]|uniref:proton-conducting transporter transmembrane domain-containing protein n=1 Tax=Novimethylophilus sp. TaxID=2137426 RepID=UPI002F41A46B